MYRSLAITSLAAISGALMLAGCATVESVQKAQATADHGLAMAGAAQMTADGASQKADQAGSMAAQAQQTATSAMQLAQSANATALQATADWRAAQWAYLFSASREEHVAYIERPAKKQHHRVARTARGERD